MPKESLTENSLKIDIATLWVDPEVEVNLRSRFFKIKESLTTNSLKNGSLLHEIWCYKDFPIKYANMGHVVN